MGLSLKFPRLLDNDCAFRILRKRESNGATIISLQQCDEGKASHEQPVLKYSKAGVVGIFAGNLDLAPSQVGPLEYDVMAQVGAAPPIFARARVDLVARDPTPPKQAAIANPQPECLGSQLRLVSPPPVVAEPLRTLRTYEATNTSTKPCSLAGVPDLRFFAEKGMEELIAPRLRCPNCANDLFAPRPNGRIDLQSGEVAHLLVATTAEVQRAPWFACSPTKTVKINLGGGDSLPLPFNGQNCATIDVSAWRQGGFDHDPLNLRWATAHAADTASPEAPIPPDCNKPELLRVGQPRMSSVWGKLQLGLSMSNRNFIAGQGVPLQIWLDNTGDEPFETSSCELDRIQYGFDLYDVYGHRVLRKQEAKLKEQCKTNPALTTLWNCTMNVPATFPAHSCVAGSTVMLSEIYDLPPGEYTVHPRQGGQNEEMEQNPCKPIEEKPFHRDSLTDITFSINQP